MAEVLQGETVAASRILVVDDEAHVCRTLARILEGRGYDCAEAYSGSEALEYVAHRPVDLALVDINMPEMNGLEVVERILCTHQDLATIMVTAVDDPTVAERALEIGAYGYVIKPFETNEILINVANALRRRRLEVQARRYQEELEATVSARTAELRTALHELRVANEDTIQRLAKAAEFRDNETAQHVQRMSHYCKMIATRLELHADRCELIRVASTMHDVGKIGVPDDVLLKPGRYTDEEYAVMKRHAEIGHRILSGSTSELLNLAAVIALTHHEKVDGSGYPQGLKGNEIPLEGRIVAVADVFDALTSKRVYKDAFPMATAIGIMVEGRGSHFDSRILDLFLSASSAIEGIRREYADL